MCLILLVLFLISRYNVSRHAATQQILQKVLVNIQVKNFICHFWISQTTKISLAQKLIASQSICWMRWKELTGLHRGLWLRTLSRSSKCIPHEIGAQEIGRRWAYCQMKWPAATARGVMPSARWLLCQCSENMSKEKKVEKAVLVKHVACAYADIQREHAAKKHGNSGYLQ